MTYPEVWEGLGSPPRGSVGPPGGSRGPPGGQSGVRRPSLRSGSRRKALPDVQEWLGGPPRRLGGPLRGPGRVGGPPEWS